MKLLIISYGDNSGKLKVWDRREMLTVTNFCDVKYMFTMCI